MDHSSHSSFAIRFVSLAVRFLPGLIVLLNASPAAAQNSDDTAMRAVADDLEP